MRPRPTDLRHAAIATLRSTRKKLGLSQTAAANTLGVHPATLMSWELGRQWFNPQLMMFAIPELERRSHERERKLARAHVLARRHEAERREKLLAEDAKRRQRIREGIKDPGAWW